jgi:hypothetical protein
MEALNRVDDAHDALVEDPALADAVKRFQQWRASRTKSERIPEALWQAAVGLYPRYNINRIARALRLDYVDVRDRIHPGGKGSCRPKAVVRVGSGNDELHFLELPTAAAGAVGECSVKVREGPRGKRISIRVKGSGVGQLLETLRGLWGAAQ